MHHFLKTRYYQWRELLKDRKYRISLLVGIGFLFVGFYLSYRAALYTDQIPRVMLGDLILDHIPTIDLSFMFGFGIFFTGLLVALYPIFFKPEIAPFTAKTVSIFVMTRAFFITLTHMGAPADFFLLPGLEDISSPMKFFFMNDLFFSGHTGFPFLAALIFWDNKFMRYFMLLMSVAQSFTVLFMHVHYSIDVFSAYFITYTIYILSDRVFNRLNVKFRAIAMRILSHERGDSR